MPYNNKICIIEEDSLEQSTSLVGSAKLGTKDRRKYSEMLEAWNKTIRYT